MDVDDISNTSPTSTSSLAEGSLLFRTVMEDFIKENQLTRNNNRDTRHNETNDRKTNSKLCRRCLSVKLSCKCKNSQTDSRTGHRVQWADELSDGQLAREHRIDCDSPLSCSPPMDVTDSIKSILKHRQDRANCIIIVAE